ncbi:MAG: hypothetical protein DCC75_08845 [Proteobacteria bacterium]|nr:MAG: hypothetical protein DCC75_08845 [Pseudomonadota bacterium]
MLGPRRNVTCEASLREPTTFMGALFGAADTRPSAQSSAYNVQFEISLVVDLSSSMDDPASEQGTCPSECDRWCNAAQGGAIRLNLAKCAANYFIDGLNDNDRVAITSFAMHDLTDVDPQFRENIDDFLDDALLEMPMTPNLNRDTRDRVKEVIDGLQMYNQRLLSDPTQTLDPQNPNAATYNQYGGTNIAAGLRLGGQQFPGSAPPAYTKRMLVLLTDGAPSIYWPIWGTPLEEVQNDPYYQCQSGSPSNTLITNCYSQGVPGGAACPFFDDHRYDYVPRHMRFLDAIAESDRVRDRMSASIYTIGLGAIDSNLNSHFQTEPVDNLNENFLPGADNIKWALLARVANDQPMMINPLFPYAPLIISGSPQDDTAPPATDYSWDFPCMRTGSTIRNKPQGKFYHASDGAASLAAFYDILKERTRVVK